MHGCPRSRCFVERSRDNVSSACSFNRLARYVFLCTWIHMLLWTVGHAELTFLEGTTPGVLTRYLINSENYVSDPIQITSAQFPIDNVTVTEAYVSENGLISFNRSVSQPPQTPGMGFYPDIMTNSDYIIAPFWSDNDIRGPERKVLYEVHTTLVNSEHLVEVSQFIRNETGTTFRGEWMLFVEWRECHPFPYGANMMTSDTYLQQINTYQAVVVTDGSMSSYAVFIYNCNGMQWGGRNSIYARVGVRIGSREIFHPFSGSSSVSDIDCANEVVSPWVNVIYDLVNFESSPSPNSTSIMPGHSSSTLQPSITSATSVLSLTPSASTITTITSNDIVLLILSQSTDIFPSTTYTSDETSTMSSGLEMSTTSGNRLQSQSDALISHTLVSHTLTTMPPIEDEQQSGMALTVGLVTAAALVVLVALVLLTTMLFIVYGKHHNKVQSTTVMHTKQRNGAHLPEGLRSSLFVASQTKNELLLLEDSYQF